MKVDAGLMGSLREVPERAKALEAVGYDGLITAETGHDPFLPIALAAEHTERVELKTGIAVAFGRNPLLLAHMGHDLNSLSRGRFILGLGSQIRAHITKRFGMPWTKPAARMREMVLATRAIWDAWYKGERLNFRGEFYSHTLMTPFFTPTDTEYGPPKVYLAAVGPHMSEVAGEVCDGIICHGFTTERYVHEVTLPAIERGLAKAGKTRESFVIDCPVFVVTGSDEESYKKSDQKIRQQVAFYASTPAYQGVLDLHGWGELQPELNRMSKEGKWVEMGGLINDEILGAFAVSGESPKEVAKAIHDRYGKLFDRVSGAYMQEDTSREAELLEALRA
jgi:probable F420-dependent oxidoreductase